MSIHDKKYLDNLFTLQNEINRFYEKNYMDIFFKTFLFLLFLGTLSVEYIYGLIQFLSKIPKVPWWFTIIVLIIFIFIIKIFRNLPFICFLTLSSVIFFIFIFCPHIRKFEVLSKHWGLITDLILSSMLFITSLLILAEYKYIVNNKIRFGKDFFYSVKKSLKSFFIRLNNKTLLEGIELILNIDLIDVLESKFLENMKSKYKIKSPEKEQLMNEISEKINFNKDKLNKFIWIGVIISIGTIITNLFNEYFKILFSQYLTLKKENIINTLHIILINWLSFFVVIIVSILFYNFYIKKIFILTKNDKLSILKHCLENLEIEN